MKSLSTALLLLFWPVTAIVLFLDAQSAFLAAGIAFVYWVLLVLCSSTSRRISALLFIPLSYIGEIIFSYHFGLYTYRMGHIPLYVPIGHSILLLVGLMLADSLEKRPKNYVKRVRKTLAITHATLITGAFIFFNDGFSAISGLILLLILPFIGSFVTFSLILGILVLYVEVIGTSLGNWAWTATSFGNIHVFNPPVGAFAYYAIGAIIAISWSGYIEKGLKRLSK